jgi:hypothetical protein
MTMREIAIWLGARQVELFENNSPIYLSVFCKGEGIRKIICDYYNDLVIEEKIIPIEKLDLEFKKELKATALDMAAGRLDTNGCIQLCKCLHVLSYHKTI